MRFLPLDHLINLHDGYRRRFKIDDLEVVLIQEGEQRWVINARCPHQQHSLEAAEIEDGILFCPLHQFGFSLTTGEHIDRFCPSLTVYQPHYEGTEIGIVVPE